MCTNVSTHHQILLNGLDEDLSSQVTGDLPDVHILRECCPPVSRYVDIVCRYYVDIVRIYADIAFIIMCRL